MGTPISVLSKQFVVAGGATVNWDINLEKFNPDGFQSIQISLSGGGNVDVSWKVSNDGVLYLKPSSQDNVLLTAFDAASGEDGNGTEFIHNDEIQNPISHFLRFIFEEKSGEEDVTLTVKIALA